MSHRGFFPLPGLFILFFLLFTGLFKFVMLAIVLMVVMSMMSKMMWMASASTGHGSYRRGPYGEGPWQHYQPYLRPDDRANGKRKNDDDYFDPEKPKRRTFRAQDGTEIEIIDYDDNIITHV